MPDFQDWGWIGNTLRTIQQETVISFPFWTWQEWKRLFLFPTFPPDNSKYLKKDFLATSESMGDETKVNMELYEAAKTGNLMEVATALARGANIDWRNDEDGGKTPMHACAICPRIDGQQKWMGIECAELLLQNGANMKLLDHSSHNVLDCAVLGSADRDMVEYLSMKFE